MKELQTEARFFSQDLYCYGASQNQARLIMPGNKPEPVLHACPPPKIPVLSSCSQCSPRPSLKGQQHLRAAYARFRSGSQGRSCIPVTVLGLASPLGLSCPYGKAFRSLNHTTSSRVNPYFSATPLSP